MPAVVARFAAREGELRASRVQPAPPGVVEPHENPVRASTRSAALVAAVTVVLGMAAAGVAGLAMRRIAAAAGRNLGEAGRNLGEARRAWSAQAVAVLAAIAVAMFAHRALGGLAAAADAVLTRRSTGEIFAGAATSVVYVLAAAVAGAVVARRRTPLSPRVTFAAVALIYLGAGYARSFPAEPHRFGAVITPAPRSETVDPFPDRARITYRTNEHGFREPSFTFEKPRGARRIVLIGDSYVFGIGVERSDTLAARLDEVLRARHPDRGFEVLNLGVPGDNVASHVDLYAEAARRLAPDDVIVCLTLPNDLSRWDIQVQQRDAGRVSTLSFAAFVLGRPALTFFDSALLEQRVTPAGLAHLEAQLARLDAIRQGASSRPRTRLFAFTRPDPQLDAALSAHPDLPMIPIGETKPADFIPGDGHPTAAGNRRFAGWIADALE